MNKRQLSLAFHLAAVCAALASACMTSPENGQAFCGPEAGVPLDGYSLYPNKQVTVRASASPSGPWVDIGTTFTDATPGPTITNKNGGQENYYAWHLAPIVLPPGAWHVENGQRAAYVMGVHPKTDTGGSDFGLVTFDTAASRPDGLSWLDCAFGIWNATNQPFQNAVLQCASRSRPVVRITAPLDSTCQCPPDVKLAGDVTLKSPSDLGALRCVAEITGNLNIENGPGFDRARLPQLRHVYGNLVADLTPPPGSSQVRQLDMPLLGRIDHDLDVRLTAPATGTSAVNLGLPSMLAVGHTMRVEVDGGAVTLSGFAMLSTLTANLELELEKDVDAAGFLPALASVTGNVAISADAGLTGLLPGLTRVDGNFGLSHSSTAPRSDSVGLTSLAEVTGQLTLQSTPWAGFAAGGAFGQLGRVGGTLRIVATRFTSFELGRPALTVGSLELMNNPALAALPPRSVRLGTTGDLTVLDNPRLPTCQIEAFVLAQGTSWAGTIAVDGNDDTVVCQ